MFSKWSVTLFREQKRKRERSLAFFFNSIVHIFYALGR